MKRSNRRVHFKLALLGLCAWAAVVWIDLQFRSPDLSAAEEPGRVTVGDGGPPAPPRLRVAPAIQPPAPGPANGEPDTGSEILLPEVVNDDAPFDGSYDPYPMPPEYVGIELMKQTAQQAHAKSHGCIVCHKNAHDPHKQPHKPLSFHLGCCDCHGGDPNAHTIAAAHVRARLPQAWAGSANPVRSYTLLNHERPEFVRFVNPGDLRVAHISCGTSGCHERSVLEVRKSMMTHGCMLWGAALYNNGASPSKWSLYGESYSMNGAPQRLQTIPPPTPEETAYKGILPTLDPLPRYQITQPGNVLRIFERGGRFKPEVGIPERLEEPGRPRQRVSNRGLGTLNRTDPVFIGLAKTRLLDPTLNFLGTNDHPGDYRSSGCTSCHIIYANDRSVVNSGPYARYGNDGTRADAPDDIVQVVDPTIPPHESGHPIEHRFTSGIPSSQCMVCHIHPGTTVMNSYLGFMWWDLETEGEMMYPHEQPHLSAEEVVNGQMSDPNEATLRGKWRNPEFLKNLTDLNPYLDKTQFGDFHGHGWVFRAVYKKDRHGRMIDYKNDAVSNISAEKLGLAVEKPLEVRQLYKDVPDLNLVKQAEEEFKSAWHDVPVHLLDVHLEKGLHCVDCHFVQDMHGNTKLYGEVRAAIEIECRNCHGTSQGRAYELVDGKPARWPEGQRPKIFTSGPAAKERPGMVPDGRELTAMRTPFGKPRFEVRGDGKVVQNSMVEPGLSWEISQVVDTLDPAHEDYNARSALAKTVRFDEGGRFAWGDMPNDPEKCAHSTTRMSCIACHSSWNPSCYGCHLPQRANIKTPELHNEGDVTRNYVSYNFQTLRDDVYMLAKDGNVTGNRINPSRSSCAIHVTSYNDKREAIYTQQQTISSEGYSGIAFSTNVPHTVRGKEETKTCTDCHVSAANDNNALMAQLTMQGTNYLNFMGRYCWVAAKDHGLFAVIATERDEPQAVFGSSLHKLAFPEHYKKHVEHGRVLEEAHEHPGVDVKDEYLRPWYEPEILDVQPRGEYCYAACGEDGVRFFDVAFIDNKGFSERITTAPFSPLGQRFHVDTKYATSIAVPTTLAPDPTRNHFPKNFEDPIPLYYGFVYATDKYEGLVIIGIATLIDGDPLNNFVKKDAVFNPGGLLCGAKSATVVGHYIYVCCDAGIVVVDIEDPLHPKVKKVLGHDVVEHPKSFEVQFRYGFAVDHEGLKVFDTTFIDDPKPVASLALPHAHSVYVARNYAYAACGKHGLYIIDVTNPERPFVDQVYTAGGSINDLHDVKLGITYSSEFAYLADGKNGMRIVQLTSPNTPGNGGFYVRPTPQLVATYPIPEGGHAYAIGEALDRDRAVDESGNQIAVFGRVGARPLNLAEQRKLYLGPDGWNVYRVIDGERDYSIEDSRKRELDLHLQLEDHFGRTRHPRRK
ncbi:hypothetical protein [Stratiformator vulcanicus]|uniref:LVIVD repeat protein n=1 Tax=Stratiformator vulcanicus TaxID=2527980 RepID=A0A517QXN2_9PLAN|nr:hypothetical protein [Stratiformator vulcanicus]QDT36412.1 LVIVD repeat protein [Stratiformator vulcanicus]